MNSFSQEHILTKVLFCHVAPVDFVGLFTKMLHTLRIRTSEAKEKVFYVLHVVVVVNCIFKYLKIF